MEYNKANEEVKACCQNNNANPERYVKGTKNLFTKDNVVKVNKKNPEVNYFRGENEVEKINNCETLFNLITNDPGEKYSNITITI